MIRDWQSNSVTDHRASYGRVLDDVVLLNNRQDVATEFSHLAVVFLDHLAFHHCNSVDSRCFSAPERRRSHKRLWLGKPKKFYSFGTYNNRYVYYITLEEKGLPSFADFVISGIYTPTKVAEYREELSYALLK